MLSSRKLDALEAAAAEIGGDVDVVVANAGDPAQAEAARRPLHRALRRRRHPGQQRRHQPLLRPDDRHRPAALRQDLGGEPPRRRWCGPSWRGRRSMQERGGSVINIASVGGLSVEPAIGIYNATKAALLHLTRTLAAELAPDVRVNAIAPGPGEDRHGPRPVGAQRGAHRRLDAAGPARRARRHRQRGAVPGQRPRVVDHRADPRGRRWRAARVPRLGGADPYRSAEVAARRTLPLAGAGQRVHQLDGARARRSAGRCCLGRGRAGRPAWAVDRVGWHHDRGDALAPLGVGSADHGHLGDRRVRAAATRSTAAGHTFSPPVTMRSPRRPCTCRRPSSSGPEVAGGEPAVGVLRGRCRRGRPGAASGPAAWISPSSADPHLHPVEGPPSYTIPLPVSVMP